MTDVFTNGVDENGGSHRKGSDPLAQTVRGKMQNRRQKLNYQINKELRMRAGAENLFRAATNKKLKEQVALELSFVNSNLQLLKEELEELNSDVEAYQNDSQMSSVPMIPLGLKETKEVDFTVPFKDFILEHYSEDCETYEKEIKELMVLRQAMRTPRRNEEGLELLYEYYNQLYFVENRFFPTDRHLGVYFHWYDSLTGVPSAQRTVAFEKGSALFNIGALYTQIGAKQDRSHKEGIEKAIENFQKAAGAFRYLSDNFSHAPSMDMSNAVLNMLVHLMLAQVQECVFEKRTIGGIEMSVKNYLEVAQEASAVSKAYGTVHRAMNADTVKDYVPYSWISLALVKSEHYKAMSHFYVGVGLLCRKDNSEQVVLEAMFPKLHVKTDKTDENLPMQIPKNFDDSKRLAKAHLHASLMTHEETMRLHRMSKMLRKIDTLGGILRLSHERAMSRYSEIDEEDEFYDVVVVPDVQAITSQKAECVLPDFSQVKVMDIFHRLGPLAIFSAKHRWSAPRKVEMERTENGFGFTVRGDSPVIVASLDEDGAAQRSGIKEGDFIVKIGEKDVKWAKHDDVVKHIMESHGQLSISVVTPQGRDFLHPQDERRLRTSGRHDHQSIAPNGNVISARNSPMMGQTKSDVHYRMGMRDSIDSRKGLEGKKEKKEKRKSGVGILGKKEAALW
ncbi:LOW QUALITY PROTEIN: rhophilin-2-like [Saccoglossus kowalevskii]|uniref:LOW QUALITY PROTEIN: rhophilin-2-like n=1 Tax=Saccoglossus kowalevskii TaxID=10224 RepID=A0ABM0MAA5_SACKO|nr:PREDICTED: LOW QUALITY PROTEIN: rhophilin-2-like [Saccoglossus kowalevskii]